MTSLRERHHTPPCANDTAHDAQHVLRQPIDCAWRPMASRRDGDASPRRRTRCAPRRQRWAMGTQSSPHGADHTGHDEVHIVPRRTRSARDRDRTPRSASHIEREELRRSTLATAVNWRPPERVNPASPRPARRHRRSARPHHPPPPPRTPLGARLSFHPTRADPFIIPSHRTPSRPNRLPRHGLARYSPPTPADAKAQRRSG
jgi:hypothetical protein